MESPSMNQTHTLFRSVLEDQKRLITLGTS